MKNNSMERFPESVLTIGNKRETARQEFAVRKKILDLLREKGPLTVPEVAQALGFSTGETHWWLMGFLRYTRVKASEKADDEGYYRYSLVEGQ